MTSHFLPTMNFIFLQSITFRSEPTVYFKFSERTLERWCLKTRLKTSNLKGILQKSLNPLILLVYE